MVNTDGNLNALRKYEDEQEKAEIAEEKFLAIVQPYIDEIGILIAAIKSSADDFEGYDFDDIIKERIKDLLWQLKQLH